MNLDTGKWRFDQTLVIILLKKFVNYEKFLD
jgi:hypothetical protein